MKRNKTHDLNKTQYSHLNYGNKFKTISSGLSQNIPTATKTTTNSFLDPYSRTT